MRLAEFTVKNYRSIGTQTRFAVGDLTTLIGPNNEGKTNLLRALGLGMTLIERWSQLPDSFSSRTELSGPEMSFLIRGNSRAVRGSEFSSVGYRWTNDYPLAKQQRRGTHPTVIRLRFRLDDEEVAAFALETGISTNGDLPIEISLSRNSASFGVVKPGRGAATHKAKAREIACFISSRLSFVYVPAVRTVDQAKQLTNDLVRMRLREINASEEYLKLAAQINELRKRAVDGMSAQLTKSVQRYLPSVSGITVSTTDFERSDAVEDLMVDDGSETSISNKGDGVKSLVTLALIQELARERARSHRFILAIDEPEAHLHASAVHELQTLLAGLAQAQQVVLATNNSIFVNRVMIGSNVLVIANEARPARTVSQIREALGVQLHDNLNSAETVVLVEGVSDSRIIPVLLEQLEPGRIAHVRSGRVVFKPSTGAGKVRQLVVREKSTVCRIIVVLDGDDAGQQEANRLVSDNMLSSREVFLLRDGKRKHSELEDLLEPSAYLPQLSREFGRVFLERHFQARSKKWTQNLDSAALELGIPLAGQELHDCAKRIVADAIVASGSAPLRESAVANLRALGELIWPVAGDPSAER
ncbi:AAA family ATPase [Cellulosimicrobium cellulans]|nr:AAA family ATPase [Cellulosimicrobium cellulans]MBE9940082.1 AAA family ATPase [Cellulosimicrobium cellulans]